MDKTIILLFRVTLVFVVLLILYFTTTSTQYEAAQSINDKVSHALAFLVLSFLADYAFPLSRFNLFKVLALIGYGILIECIQYFLSYREFSLLDMIGDGVGIVVYWFCIPLVSRLPVLRQRQQG